MLILNGSAVLEVMMYCEYFTEICQTNNFGTYKNALLSNGLLQMCLN